MKVIRLRDGKDRSLLRRHPWVFAGSIEKGKADPGETVRVEAQDGRFLAWGAFSPASQIRVRAWSFDEAERIDAALLRAPHRHRRGPAPAAGGAERRCAPGARRGRRPARPGGRPLRRHCSVRPVPLRRHRALEAVIADSLLAPPAAAACTNAPTPACALWRGWSPSPAGCAGSGATEATIQRACLAPDARRGRRPQDRLLPRPARQPRPLGAGWVRHFGVQRVLNCYSYTGGFSVAALAGGAEHVTSVDSSAPALARAERARGLERPRCHAASRCVMPMSTQFLREAIEAGEQLRRHRAGPAQVRPHRGARRTRRARLQGHQPPGLKLLAPGGLLLTFSVPAACRRTCSTRSWPARRWTPASTAPSCPPGSGARPPDHADLPEGEYLKGLAILQALKLTRAARVHARLELGAVAR
jgi:23S rRNA (cytosine1962-C5)-methyltransferase